jgi:hypothetical protein
MLSATAGSENAFPVRLLTERTVNVVYGPPEGVT